MKKKLILVAIATFMVIGAATMGNIFASSTSAGGVSDPLVSKSYVDGKINEVLSTLSSAGQLDLSIAGQQEDGTAEKQETYYADEPATPVGQYVPVSATAGQVIVGGEGTEIILRSGSANGYVEGENGIVNVSTGAEIFDGDVVDVNNMLIIPRDDGRGVSVVRDAWFIIKGSYEILD